jgi:hypothetical protein
MCSLMSVDETPVKALPASPQQARRVGTSRSMYNLASANKATAVAPAPPPLPSAHQQPTNNSSAGSSTSSTQQQPASAPPGSPSKQQQVAASRPAPPTRNATAPAQLAPPQYDPTDEDNLPSPFLKKKTSTGAPTSVMAAAMRMARGAVHRPAPAAPTATMATRAARPSGGTTTGTRQSLAGRLAIARAAKAEEERQQAAVAAGQMTPTTSSGGTGIPRSRRESVSVS